MCLHFMVNRHIFSLNILYFIFTSDPNYSTNGTIFYKYAFYRCCAWSFTNKNTEFNEAFMQNKTWDGWLCEIRSFIHKLTLFKSRKKINNLYAFQDSANYLPTKLSKLSCRNWLPWKLDPNKIVTQVVEVSVLLYLIIWVWWLFQRMQHYI